MQGYDGAIQARIELICMKLSTQASTYSLRVLIKANVGQVFSLVL